MFVRNNCIKPYNAKGNPVYRRKTPLCNRSPRGGFEPGRWPGHGAVGGRGGG